MIAIMAEQHNGVEYHEDVVAVFTTQEKADNFLESIQDFFEHQKVRFYKDDDYVTPLPPPVDPETIDEVIW